MTNYIKHWTRHYFPITLVWAISLAVFMSHGASLGMLIRDGEPLYWWMAATALYALAWAAIFFRTLRTFEERVTKSRD